MREEIKRRVKIIIQKLNSKKILISFAVSIFFLFLLFFITPFHFRNFGPIDQIGNVHVEGNYAFITDGNLGLGIIDISNPLNNASPIFVDTSGMALRVIVSDGYAYIANMESGLAIINVTNPDEPGNPIYVDLEGDAKDVFTYDKFAFVIYTNTFYDIFGNLRYNSGLAIINITNPMVPATPIYKQIAGYAQCIYIHEGYAYIGMHRSGFVMINISDLLNPSNPVYINRHVSVFDITISGDYAFMTHGEDGLSLINISNPTSLGSSKFIDTIDFAIDIVVSENFVYVADYGSGWAIIDISDPNKPRNPIYIDTEGKVRSIFSSGNYIFITEQHQGLKIFNIVNILDDIVKYNLTMIFLVVVIGLFSIMGIYSYVKYLFKWIKCKKLEFEKKEKILDEKGIKIFPLASQITTASSLKGVIIGMFVGFIVNSIEYLQSALKFASKIVDIGFVVQIIIIGSLIGAMICIILCISVRNAFVGGFLGAIIGFVTGSNISLQFLNEFIFTSFFTYILKILLGAIIGSLISIVIVDFIRVSKNKNWKQKYIQLKLKELYDIDQSADNPYSNDDFNVFISLKFLYIKKLVEIISFEMVENVHSFLDDYEIQILKIEKFNKNIRLSNSDFSSWNQIYKNVINGTMNVDKPQADSFQKFFDEITHNLKSLIFKKYHIL